MTYFSKINFIIDKLNFQNFYNLRNKIYLHFKKNRPKNYDYGKGYFYQSFDNLKITGLRDTEKRIKKLKIEKLILNKDIVDIGCNTGFFLLSLRKLYKSGLGIDNCKGSISTANFTKNIIKCDKTKFVFTNFLNYKITKKYDVVLSLASHYTFDKGSNNKLLYFNKINSMIKKNGYLILESHHPDYESEKSFLKFINLFRKNYKFTKKIKYDFKNYFDYGRIVFILNKTC